MLYIIRFPSWLGYAGLCLLLPPSLLACHLVSNRGNPDHFNNVCRGPTPFIVMKALWVCHRLSFLLSGGLYSLRRIWNPNRLPLTSWPAMDFSQPPDGSLKAALFPPLAIKDEPEKRGEKPTFLSHKDGSTFVKSAICFPGSWHDPLALSTLDLGGCSVLRLKHQERNNNSLRPSEHFITMTTLQDSDGKPFPCL